MSKRNRNRRTSRVVPALAKQDSRALKAEMAVRQMFRARLDAAQQSDDLSKWWAGADAGGPNWTYRHDVRATIRKRARYEVANNSYAFGIVQTIATHTIGTGPQLQLTGPVREWNVLIENAWHEHIEAINLVQRLTSMVAARIYDGESFGCLYFNPILETPCSIDMRVIETDQVHDPISSTIDPRNLDGVMLDEWGNPVEYRLLKHHPGENNSLAAWQHDTWSRKFICHLFRQDRPGQMRGISELTPALTLFAVLRRFTRATLSAAEAAAMFAAFLKTTAASVTPDPNEDPFGAMDIDFGTLTSLPQGWDVSQLKPEHPATTYPQFVNQLLQEISRCLSVPQNIALCNSSGYNFSSSKLDHNLYYRKLSADQQQICRVVLNKLLEMWFLEAVEKHPRLIGLPRDYIRARQWFWDPPETIDPQAESSARDTDLRNGTTTIPVEYAKKGMDYETAQQQAAESLGLSLEEYRRRQADVLFPPSAVASVSPTNGTPTSPDQAVATASASGEYSAISRLQLQRNRKAIDDLMQEMLSGQRTQQFALAMLQVYGLTESTAQALIDATLGDSSADPQAVESAALAACASRRKPHIRPALMARCIHSEEQSYHLTASAGQKLIAAPSGTATLNQATAGGKPPRAKIHAYSGGELNVDGFDLPVVVDLNGVSLHTDNIPYLSDHKEDSDHTVGQSSQVTVGPGGIDSDGQILGENEATRNVVKLAANGFKWPVSIGGVVMRPERIAPGAVVSVNGRDFVGPLIVARAFVLREISFVPVGADPSASASLAARAASQIGVSAMSFEQWCAEQGFDCATLTDPQKAALMVSYQAATAAPADPAAAAAQQTAAPVAVAPATAAAGCATDPNRPVQAAAGQSTLLIPSQQNLMLASARQQLAAEDARVLQIRRLTAAAETNDGIATIRKQAIEEGWTTDRTELAVLRAQGANRAPAVIIHNPNLAPQVLQAALYRGVMIKHDENEFTPQVLEASRRQFPRGIGLQELLLTAAAMHGFQAVRINDGNMRHVLQAAFSTAGLTNILSSTANKALLDGYRSVGQQWKRISKVRSLNDFKSTPTYRLTTEGQFEEVGATGKIKHGSLDEETYSIQAKTYARMISINRQMIRNDDADALSDVPFQLGRKGGTAFNRLFWATFMANTDFFKTANSNILTGTTYVLGHVGLSEALVTFRGLTDPSGDPLDMEPKLLLVPKELEETALSLYVSTNVNTGGAATTAKVANKNVFEGKFEPVQVPYLSNSSYTGYSSTAYYLLADPMDAPAMQVGFLDGVQEPIVETADADFDELGIQMRGYFDFGLALMDPHCGVKVTGVAP